MIVLLRSLLFFLGGVIFTPPFSLLAILVLPLPPVTRYRIVSLWSRFMLWWLKLTCGTSYKVIGRENIPDTPCVIFSKHQSAWETLAFQQIFPPQSFVTKRELILIPFFGWGLATFFPILINRNDKRHAAQELQKQGEERVRRGFWIVIFPEGTRMAPGEKGEYRQGGARLACQLHVPLLPVALNAGEFWPKNSFLKYPGEITAVIGKPIPTENRASKELMREAEAWIEARQPEISGVGPAA